MNTDGAAKSATRRSAAPAFLTSTAGNRRHDGDAIADLKFRHVLANCGNSPRRISARHERQHGAARICAFSYRQIKAAIDRYGCDFQNDFVERRLRVGDVLEQKLLRTPKGTQHHSLHSRSPFAYAQTPDYECDKLFALTSDLASTSLRSVLSPRKIENRGCTKQPKLEKRHGMVAHGLCGGCVALCARLDAGAKYQLSI